MKRDMNLIREILLLVEEKASLQKPLLSDKIQIPGYTEEQITDHVSRLAKAHLIETVDVSSHDGFAWFIKGLTNDGDNLVDKIRDNNVWEKVLEGLKDVSGEVTKDATVLFIIELIKSLFK